jgi:hypothetical protein
MLTYLPLGVAETDMIANMRAEFRASVFLLFIVAAYFASACSFIAAYKGGWDWAVFKPYQILNEMLLEVWGATIGCLAIVYCVKLFFTGHTSTIPARFAADFKAFLRPEVLFFRVAIFVSWFLLAWSFTSFKTMIGSAHGFTMDPGIAALERAVLFGHDAWQYTHFLFGSLLATFVLQLCYNVWLALMWGSIMLCLVFVDDVRTVLHYLLAFILCWIIVGSLAAYFLASAGPCFYERVLGDAHFQPLMSRLHEIDSSLDAILPNLGLASLDVQEMLWKWQMTHHDGLGAGISAMPSVHVGLAFVMARGAYLLRPVYGKIMMVYVAAIWIGSVHLGWHYALDGAIALLLVVPIWKISGRLAGICLDMQGQRVAQGALAG